jgi:outer membrane lipoprotein carrier protein
MRIVVLLLALGLAADLAAGEARDRLDAFFSDVVTLDARFAQQVIDDTGQIVQESSGTVQLLRPGRVRWDYETPFKQLIVADGQYLWVYDSELAQATVRELGTALGAAPIMLLSQRRSIDEDFVVLEEVAAEGLEWVELKPKVRDTDFLQVRIGMDPEGIRAMELTDQFEQRTVIRFEDVSINGDIPASRFRFDVPPGVDVIGPGT